MRFSGLVILFCLLASTAFAQAKAKTPAAKLRPSAAKQVDDKAKSAAKKDSKNAVKQTTKPKTPPSKTSAAKQKETPPAKPKPKPKVVKPKVEEPEISEEDLEALYQKAVTVEAAVDRIVALKEFVSKHPKATRASDAAAMIVTIRTQVANDLLTNGDISGAVEGFKSAITDAPKPMPDQLFVDTLAKFPPNLYFRGARPESFEIAKLIEKKVDKSVAQLTGVANFYMSVENGSEARRLAEKAVKLDPSSSLAYQTLGLASRMDFLLDESAAAYIKAVELDPESLAARRGLAEMRRALGQSDDAVLLYRSIVEKDPTNLAAHTGLILALFEADRRSDAETELAKSLEENPGNIILQAGAAYWYAIHGEGNKAVDFAQKAIATDPRFIWSHVALARGQIAQGNPVAAEKTLLAARRYGNFPTIEYEIAAARMSAGFYREAAEELAKSFSVKDGKIFTKLGGRVERGSKNLAELIGFERKASIFAPSQSDSEETSAQMIGLLQLKQELDKSEPSAAMVSKAADEFVTGGDKMKVHRILFASSQMLEKKLDLPKVVELTKSAPSVLDAGLDAPNPTTATLASELYESRSLAAARGQYVDAPPIPRATLSAVLRGRVEEITGWAHYQMDDASQASVHLKRAVTVLPVDSAWWRSSTWRLGNSLALEGKNAEALEFYVRNYKSGQPDPLKYNVIEALYKRVNGHTMGLEQRIGINPNANATPSTQTLAQNPRPTSAIPLVIKPSPTPETPRPSPPPEIVPSPTVETAKPDPSPMPTPEPTPEPAKVEPSPTPSEKPAEPLPSPTPEPTPEPIKAEPSPTVEPTQQPSPTPDASPTPETVEAKPETLPTAESTPETTPSPEPAKTPAETTVAKEKPSATRLENSNGLFPPVVINIPPRPKTESTPKPAGEIEKPTDEPTPTEPKVKSTDGRERVISGVPARTEDVIPCTLTLDQDSVVVQSGGNERAVVVRRTDDGDVEGMTGSSLSPDDVTVRREPLPGVKWTALFVLRSASGKLGNYRVRFETPCGKKEISVNVR